jgi:hypothetical protein
MTEHWNEDLGMEVLLGKTLTKFDVGGNSVEIECSDGSKYSLFHSQDCCEHVYIEDVCGDVNDLLGHALLMSERVTNRDDEPQDDRYYESWTWTFFKFATVRGYVTVRFFGTSNGYYSETADLHKLAAD